MRKFGTLLAVFVLLQGALTAQYFTTSGILIRPPGQSFGVILTSPTGLTGNTTFTLPDKSGTLIVDDGSGVSSAWLVGGNTLLPTVGPGPGPGASSKLGSLTQNNVDIVAFNSIRLTVDHATNSLTTGQGTELRFLEPTSGTNYTAFKAQSQLVDVTYTLPNADGTSGQVLTTSGTGALSWTTVAGGGGGGNISARRTTDATVTAITATDDTQMQILLAAGKTYYVKALFHFTSTGAGISNRLISGLAFSGTLTSVAYVNSQSPDTYSTNIGLPSTGSASVLVAPSISSRFIEGVFTVNTAGTLKVQLWNDNGGDPENPIVLTGSFIYALEL